MAARRFKPGKIIIVLILTALIWIWADLALDETPPPRQARIFVGASADRFWVSFSQEPWLDVEVTLSGPHSAFRALDRFLQKQALDNRFEFVFNASAEQMSEPGGYRLGLLDFLQKDEQLKRLGLKVKDCEPQIADVNIVGLVKKPVTVECLDENGLPLQPEVNPPTVEMWVPESYRTARVQLSRGEIETARLGPITKRPYILLAADQKREAPDTVEIKLMAGESPLSEATIYPSRPGIVFSPTIQGKYEVKINNNNMILLTSGIKIRATAAAKQAYQAMPYHALLEIGEEDVKPGEHPRYLRYIFPDEFVRKNQIQLNQAPVEVLYELIKISPDGS